MTLDTLQKNYVLMLSNSCYCRYYIHWNYPQQSPWLMAVAILDCSKGTKEALLERGFKFEVMETDDCHSYFTIERTDENGNPFKSNLY